MSVYFRDSSLAVSTRILLEPGTPYTFGIHAGCAGRWTPRCGLRCSDTLDQALYSGTGTGKVRTQWALTELCHAERERERESAANQRRRHGRGTANLTISARLLIGLPERTTPC